MSDRQPFFIVTGASSGIGRAVCVDLAGRNCRVLGVARSGDELQKLAGACKPNISYVAADLATKEGIALVAARVADRDTINGIVHSAGSLVPLEPMTEIDTDELAQHFRIHVGGPVALVQALSQTRRIERMIFVDSYSASTPRNGWAVYSIVKAAAQMAARCVAEEYQGTDVVRVFPGAVQTRIVDLVLASKTPTAKVFAEMLANDQFATPSQAAAFITKILVDASDDVIRSQATWDYNSDDDQLTLSQAAPED